MFSQRGDLLSEKDRNGYTTSFSYTNGQLTGTTDPAGRTLTLVYTGIHVTSASDVAGRAVSYGYDSSSTLTSVTDVNNGVTSFAYDSSHLLTVMKDPVCSADTSGQCLGVRNVYDTSGRVKNQTDQMNRQTTFAYSPGGTTVTDPKANVNVYNYNADELTSVTYGSGTSQAATWQYQYDPVSLGIAQMTDPNLHTSTSQWDANGNLLSHKDGLLRQTSYTYDSINDVTSITDPLNQGTSNGTTLTYDPVGNLLQVSRPLLGASPTQSQVTKYQYTDGSHPGDVTGMVDPDGKLWQYGYDQYGNKTSVTDPLSNKTTYTYDKVGRRQSKIAPQGNVTGGNPSTFTTSYLTNAFGDVTQVTDPLQHRTKNQYDANRNIKVLMDANTRQTSYTYDFDNEPTQVTRPDSSSQKTTYDADGNVYQQVDGLNNTTSYLYDPLNRLASVTDPLNRKASFVYDGVGNVKTVTDAPAQLTTNVYDASDELTTVSYSDGTPPNVTSIHYDADAHRQDITHGTGKTTYAFDSLHRLTQSATGAGNVVKYGYDLKDQLTSLTYPDGTSVVSRGYDDVGRLHTVTDWLNHQTIYNYDPDSNLSSVVYPNGVTATLTADAADRLMTISDAKGANSPFLNLTYQRDSVNDLTSDGTNTFGYDSLNRTTNFNSSSANYGYNAADELTQTPANSSFAYDPANELTAMGEP